MARHGTGSIPSLSQIWSRLSAISYGYAHGCLVSYFQVLFYLIAHPFHSLAVLLSAPDGGYLYITYTIVCNDIAAPLRSVMDASSLLALPTSPAASGLQIFALFINFFFPGLALIVVCTRVAGRVAARQFAVDDWLVCVAMLMSVAETVISFFCTSDHLHAVLYGGMLTQPTVIKTNFVGIPRNQVPPP